MTAPIQPGAEPWSHAGGPTGALCLHGFTGNPQSMRPVADALGDAGFTVELPLLPGHGTAVEDMLDVGWKDWTDAVDTAYTQLAARCEQVVVAGLSMGGGLTLWLAAQHPEIAGIICINPAVQPPDPDMLAMVRSMVDSGERTFQGGIGADIADPDVTELAYGSTPLQPLLSLADGLGDLVPQLGSIRCPLLLLSSRQDHVVDPVQGDFLAQAVAGPVERVHLERSYHVATLDYDRDLVIERSVAFARHVTGVGPA